MSIFSVLDVFHTSKFQKKAAALSAALIVSLAVASGMWGGSIPVSAAAAGAVSSGTQPLLVRVQPKDAAVKPGDTVTFSVTADGGSGALSYQWYYKKNGAGTWSLWKGHAAASTSAPANDSWNGMEVYCKVTDSAGQSVSSNAATVTFCGELKLLTQPSDVTAKSGETVTFSAKASGDGLTYIWYYKKSGASDWTLWKGHTSASTSAVANDSWHGMQVCCQVTDGAGKSISSNAATVTLSGGLKLLNHPSDVSAKSGETVTFSVKASGSGLQYQWYYQKAGASDWSLWKGHTTASTSAPANDSWNGMRVYCRVTDSAGRSVSSNAATVTISVPLKLLAHPSNVSVKSGETATFSVKATGNGLQYQWYYKKAGASAWSLWKGHAAAITSAPANNSWDGMRVYCKVTDTTGKSVDSNAASVTLTGPKYASPVGGEDRFIERTLIIKSNGTTVYSNPGTSNKKMGTVSAGQKYRVTDMENDSKGTTWYAFTLGGKKVWISRHSATISDKYTTIPDRHFGGDYVPMIYISPSRQVDNAYATGSTTEQIQMYRVGRELKAILDKEYVCSTYIPAVSVDLTLDGRSLDAYKRHTDIYLAIHSNADPAGTSYGATGFYFPACAQSKELAKNMVTEMARIAPKKSTVSQKLVNGMLAFDKTGYAEVRDPAYYGMVSLLAEVEFHDNRDSAQWIMNHPKEIARALANALEKTFALQKK